MFYIAGLTQKLDYLKELDAFKVAAALELTAKGQVVVYYGEEIGLYGADNYPYQTNRYDSFCKEQRKESGYYAA